MNKSASKQDTKQNTKQITINTGIDSKAREAVLDILNTTLADVVTLYLKTRNFHWNVEGAQFRELHKFFESQYESLDETMDEIAERARALDGYAPASMAEYLKLTRLQEAAGKARSATAMLEALLADHETICRNLRSDIARFDRFNDPGTEDFLTSLLEGHEKMAWMLRAYLR
jgi:starvation-inducible DNA-binding protein